MNSTVPRQIQKLNLPKNLSKFRKKNNKNKIIYNDPFAQCVLHPFDGPMHRLNSLPDGDNSQRLLIDHSSYTDFTINSGGSISMRILPTLPYNVLYKPGTGTVYTITDPVLGTNTGTWGSNKSNVWCPANSINQYTSIITSNNLGTTVSPPYNQTKCRLISLAWRLIYTGTVSNGSGVVTCRDIPINVDAYSTISANGLYGCTNDNGSGGLVTTATNVALVDFPSGAGAIDVGKCVFTRLDENPWGIVKRNSRIYNWSPFTEQPFTLISSSTTSGAIINATTTPITCLVANPNSSLVNIGINYFSSDFNSTEIYLSTLASNVSYRLEVKACYEYMVLPSSPVYSLTKTPAKVNLESITAVQEKQSTLPAALPNGTVIKNPPIVNPQKVANELKSEIKQTKSIMQTIGSWFTSEKPPQVKSPPRPKVGSNRKT